MTPDWMLAAKCRGSNPAMFDSESILPATVICAGCPVQVDCARWYSEPVSVSAFIEQLGFECPDDEDDVVFLTQIKAAGVDL